MKIRCGFVSNSSSSSFLIEIIKESKPCPTCGHKNDIIEVIDYSGNHDTYIVYSDIDECIRDVKADISYKKERNYDYNDSKKILDELTKIKENNGNIIFVEISYHDKHVLDTLRQAIENNEVRIINSDVDYCPVEY